MFSMKSTWKEIKTTKPVDTALGDLFPTCWSILLQGHEEETMEQIHDSDPREISGSCDSYKYADDSHRCGGGPAFFRIRSDPYGHGPGTFPE